MEMKVHQIKIDFNVTEQISRFVYVYILESDSLYLIDSRVFGCEKQIMDYVDSIGRNKDEIKGNEREMRKTLHILKDTKGVKMYYPAWDQTYTAEAMDSKLNEAGELINLLKKTVSESDDGGELPVLVDRVCDRLKMPMLKSNPLFSRTIECLRQEA